MSFRSLLRLLLRLLIPLALSLTVYLYLYPVFGGCAFPSTDRSRATAFVDTFRQHVTSRTKGNGYKQDSTIAPFRLLVLADPQLEGDSSLPKPEDGLFPRLQQRWTRLTLPEPTFDHPSAIWHVELRAFLLEDIPRTLQALRKRIDLFGNDYYLAHIYRTLHWWTRPSHITVLGDLIGSQWVDDAEFEWRGWRFWNRVMRHGVKVPDEWTERHYGNRMPELDDPAWKRRVINVVGNHDIGYAGDISRHRLDRFERVFGKANWDTRFEYSAGQSNPLSNGNQYAPTLHLVVLNTMNLDTPALDEDLQRESYEYLNQVMNQRSHPVEDKTSFTLLLTHVPLHKEAGTCIDPPFFDYWDDTDGGGAYRPHGLKEQNHLSYHASRQGILEGIFGMSGREWAPADGSGRPGLILTGHDHEGCDVWHYIPTNDTMREADERGVVNSNWQATRWQQDSESLAASSHAGVREVTLRSMMGDFGGNAGLLSAWFDFNVGEWRYDIQMCRAGVQHFWWAVHIVDLVTLVLVVLAVVLRLLAGHEPVEGKGPARRKAGGGPSGAGKYGRLPAKTEENGRMVEKSEVLAVAATGGSPANDQKGAGSVRKRAGPAKHKSNR